MKGGECVVLFNCAEFNSSRILLFSVVLVQSDLIVVCLRLNPYYTYRTQVALTCVVCGFYEGVLFPFVTTRLQ